MRSTLHHPDNDHWQEWREAVKRTGWNSQLAHAAHWLLKIEDMTPQQVETLFAVFGSIEINREHTETI